VSIASMFARSSPHHIRTAPDLGVGVLLRHGHSGACGEGRPVDSACGFSAAWMRGWSDGEQPRDRHARFMGTTALGQAIGLASTMLLMVLGGLAKGRLEWHPRPPFWRRWRR
jgi:hypothetical protein